jgi:hypothetical protein
MINLDMVCLLGPLPGGVGLPLCSAGQYAPQTVTRMA